MTDEKPSDLKHTGIEERWSPVLGRRGDKRISERIVARTLTAAALLAALILTLWLANLL